MSRLQVEVPDFIVGADLQERLRRFHARLVCGEGSASIVVVDDPRPLEGLLRELNDWVEEWALAEAEVRLDRRIYRLHAASPLTWREATDV